MICLIDKLGDALKHKDTFLICIDYLFVVGWLAIIYVFLSKYKVKLRNSKRL